MFRNAEIGITKHRIENVESKNLEDSLRSLARVLGGAGFMRVC